MGISADAIFYENKVNKWDAYSHMGTRGNFIEIGSDYFILEVFIHEINEVEINGLLWNFCNSENVNIEINGFTSRISHFISPFGENSFIDPYHYKDETPNGIKLLE